jgi:hypothetical protein
MLFRAIKKFREICKKEAEISAAQRRLARMPIDYYAIQTICDTVSSGYNVEITIKNNDGSTIIIKRGSAKEEVPYKSFAEKFKDYQNGVK